MASFKTVRFQIDIEAPVSTVFRTMLDPGCYRQWASAFAEGTYYEGEWRQGGRLRFLAPSGDGMLSEVAEHRPDECTSIRHLGMIAGGAEDTSSDMARAWASARETYRFVALPGGTRVEVEQDATEEFVAYLADAWPKALQQLKALCEGGAAG
ncbi:ATPase [Rubrivivax gelatinosus]|nr:ATPase [Rubrivivax gelatinosus]